MLYLLLSNKLLSILDVQEKIEMILKLFKKQAEK